MIPPLITCHASVKGLDRIGSIEDLVVVVVLGSVLAFVTSKASSNSMHFVIYSWCFLFVLKVGWFLSSPQNILLVFVCFLFLWSFASFLSVPLLFVAQQTPAERKTGTSKQVVAATLVGNACCVELQIVVQKEIVAALSNNTFTVQSEERRARSLIAVGGGRKREEPIEVGPNGDFLGSVVVQKEGGLLCEKI